MIKVHRYSSCRRRVQLSGFPTTHEKKGSEGWVQGLHIELPDQVYVLDPDTPPTNQSVPQCTGGTCPLCPSPKESRVLVHLTSVSSVSHSLPPLRLLSTLNRETVKGNKGVSRTDQKETVYPVLVR